ncbi:MAG: FAD-dependent oxidoreductase, partial [Acidiferrobacterales bacterium]
MIIRQPHSASQETYDLIIIGGGIYGSMLALAASKKGLRPLLIERGDFGEATSHNSLRIIHGGLRYLQNLDLRRFHESVQDRRWFLQNFPDLVKPLPCAMPVYANRLPRLRIYRTALLINDFLSRGRNEGIGLNSQLPNGKIVSANQICDIFPLVDKRRLKGAAIWYDAWMPDSQRLLIELLRWACGLGATALNYVDALKLFKSKTGVGGVVATDRISGELCEFRAKVVINATGPWCGELAQRFGRAKSLPFNNSLAWNVLFDEAAISKDYAVAVAPKKPGAQTYFLLPWKGRLLAGTGHARWNGSVEQPMPS